jgi:hypothetical protein
MNSLFLFQKCTHSLVDLDALCLATDCLHRLRHKNKLGGIVSISGFVPLLPEYPKFFRKANRSTEILAINGFEDSFVRRRHVSCRSL